MSQLPLFAPPTKSAPERIGSVLVRVIQKLADPDPNAPRPFVGKYMHARFQGRCCVCGTGIDTGASIVYDAGSKRAAHLGCGQTNLRTKAR